MKMGVIVQRKGWRSTRFGHLVHRFFGIHDVVGHTKKNCWCKGTSREVTIPENFVTDSQVAADVNAFYGYVSRLNATGYDCKDPSCNHDVPHKHGFACDVTCMSCRWITEVRDGG